MKKHLKFYKACMRTGETPRAGLCTCAHEGYIDSALLELFEPTRADFNGTVSLIFWGVDRANYPFAQHVFNFNPLRQNIVLFMAAINNEL